MVGVLCSLVIGAIAGLIGAFTGIATLTKLIYGAWMIIVIVGTWKSSDKYKGPKYWPILAKIGVVVGTIQVFSSFSQY